MKFISLSLQDSKFPTYARMASFMESQKPKVFTSSNADGVDRVLESPGQYAFLMESNSIQYQTERNCELTQIGGLLDSKGYGIAFTPGNLILSTGDREEALISAPQTQRKLSESFQSAFSSFISSVQSSNLKHISSILGHFT